jgi:hypothetical protein
MGVFRNENAAARSSRDTQQQEKCSSMDVVMALPKKICALCEEEFELKPDKPGFANHCPTCTAFEMEEAAANLAPKDADQIRYEAEVNEARRASMKNLLYSKDS